MNREQSLRRPLRPKFNEYIFEWSSRFTLLCFGIGAFVIPLILEIAMHPYTFYKVFLFSGFVFGCIGGVWALIDRANRFDDLFLESLEPQQETAVEPLPEKPKRDCTVLLDLKNGLPSVTLWQPRPGSFTTWSRQVASENTKVQFSENQANMRKWPLDRYHEMVAQLKIVGLLHSHDMHNGAPVVTDEGKVKLKEWLRDHV